jgi:hypothetical protein
MGNTLPMKSKDFWRKDNQAWEKGVKVKRKAIFNIEGM